MERAKIITPFTEEEIHKIYRYLLEYSIRNYELNEENYKNFFSKRYDYAKGFASDSEPVDVTTEELVAYLTNEQKKYQETLNINHDIIELNQMTVLTLLINNMPKTLTNDIEKLHYLVNFMIEYVSFSTDCFNYCKLTPPTNGIEFDFKNQVPVEQNNAGVLVQGQGLCDNICDALVFIGRQLNIPIRKEIIKYNERLHAVNALLITSESGLDETISIIDTARMISEGAFNEQYFLVDRATLSKTGNYFFKTAEDKNALENAISLPTSNLNTSAYNIQDTIKQIKEYLPEIEVIETNAKIK